MTQPDGTSGNTPSGCWQMEGHSGNRQCEGTDVHITRIELELCRAIHPLPNSTGHHTAPAAWQEHTASVLAAEHACRNTWQTVKCWTYHRCFAARTLSKMKIRPSMSCPVEWPKPQSAPSAVALARLRPMVSGVSACSSSRDARGWSAVSVPAAAAGDVWMVRVSSQAVPRSAPTPLALP